jgi:hypothetical protein
MKSCNWQSFIRTNFLENNHAHDEKVMKCIYSTLLLFFSLALVAQKTAEIDREEIKSEREPEREVIDDVTKKDMMAERKVLPYAVSRQQDIFLNVFGALLTLWVENEPAIYPS